MRCPFCSQRKDRVVDSRESREGRVIRRRRECLACGRRFTSYEELEEVQFMVVKRDGRREPFDRKKLLSGLSRACEKRPVPTLELERIVLDLDNQVREREEREMATAEIGEIVMERLRELDQVAYVRFASVYRQFEDADQFLTELKGLLATTDEAAPASTDDDEPEPAPSGLENASRRRAPRGGEGGRRR